MMKELFFNWLEIVKLYYIKLNIVKEDKKIREKNF